MRPIGFHTVPRRLITVGQRVGSKLLCGALLITGAVATVLYGPFLIGGWIMDRLQEPKARTEGPSQEWVEE